MIEPREGDRQIQLKEYALAAPRMAKLVVRLVRDPRVPSRNKAMLLFAAGYLLSPIDLVPEFVPGLGRLDDLVVAALAIHGLLNDVPDDVVKQHWDGDDDVLEIVRDVLQLSASMVPASVRKLFSSR
jgi:uncharacterized membrane protein YkvA (DUF1232 family)